MSAKDIVVWDTKNDGGVRVLVREQDGRAYVVLEDRFGRYIRVPPGHAAELASGTDRALERIGRDGRIARVG